jgi:hypothetical protein
MKEATYARNICCNLTLKSAAQLGIVSLPLGYNYFTSFFRLVKEQPLPSDDWKSGTTWSK